MSVCPPVCLPICLSISILPSCPSVSPSVCLSVPLYAVERHDALYVVGSLDETLELRGMRYHPIDIETSVIRAHKSIAEW